MARQQGAIRKRQLFHERQLASLTANFVTCGLKNFDRFFECRFVYHQVIRIIPIYHRAPERVRAHVFLAMLAYYVEWHMRQALAPVLFDDEQRGDHRPSPVALAKRSPEARAKASTQRTADNWPVQSFQDWLKDLATIVKNRIEPRLRSLPAFEMTTRPTAAQQYALDLLRVRLQ
jgi:hypothetical protein